MLSAAANAAGIPSVLVTNFTFDSVYSYLSTLIADEQDATDAVSASEASSPLLQPKLAPDVPISQAEVEPLVRHLWDGYRCANLLLRLPGAIPIPSFASEPALPSPNWVSLETRRFSQDVLDHLSQDTTEYTLLQQIPFAKSYSPKNIPRSIVSAPLLVRSPDPSVYTDNGRRRLMDTIGIPLRQQNNPHTKVLIVSFGGQVFHKPSSSRSHSRTPSNAGTPGFGTGGHPVLGPSNQINGVPHVSPTAVMDEKRALPTEPKNSEASAEALATALQSSISDNKRNPMGSLRLRPTLARKQSLLMIPGAPAASVPASPVTATVPAFPTVVPPTPKDDESIGDPFDRSIDEVEELQDEVFGTLLPDESWIAVVCGVSKDWAMEDGEALPENFYVAPKEIYMPDLTAVADVLLGKLVRSTSNSSGYVWLTGELQGYGTVSECVDSCTPFVYGQ